MQTHKTDSLKDLQDLTKEKESDSQKEETKKNDISFTRKRREGHTLTEENVTDAINRLTITEEKQEEVNQQMKAAVGAVLPIIGENSPSNPAASRNTSQKRDSSGHEIIKIAMKE